ncbi:hypothetical protein [Sorangium sp. So ce1024]|uniref:hypothetical protein n=1 Tax=Sorangium sp. So ce1024 TaxID=3133327 RepID=UPI003EFFFA1A
MASIRPRSAWSRRRSRTSTGSRRTQSTKRALLEENFTAPRDIVLGESSLDEMRIGLFDGFVEN